MTRGVGYATREAALEAISRLPRVGGVMRRMRSSSSLGRSAPVLVAGEHVEVAVGPLDDRAQAAVIALEQDLLPGDLAAVEPQPVQRLAAQRGEHVVAAPPRVALEERGAGGRDRLLVDAQRRVEALVVDPKASGQP